MKKAKKTVEHAITPLALAELLHEAARPSIEAGQTYAAEKGLDARSFTPWNCLSNRVREGRVSQATVALRMLAARGLRIARVPGRPRFRHADTGEYVSAGEAARNPDRVVSET